MLGIAFQSFGSRPRCTLSSSYPEARFADEGNSRNSCCNNSQQSEVLRAAVFCASFLITVVACCEVLAAVAFSALGVKWSQQRGWRLNPAVPTKFPWSNPDT